MRKWTPIDVSSTFIILFTIYGAMLEFSGAGKFFIDFSFAAAALTGGDPYKTTMMAWKYTLPAFIVPFMFTLHPDGVGLLLVGP